MTEESIVLPPRVREKVPPLPIVRIRPADENFEQSSRPCGSDPYDLISRIKGGYKMLIKKGTSRITLLRFLLAKLVYSMEGLSIEEFLCVFHLYYDLTEMSDPLFNAKWKSFLEGVKDILDDISGEKEFPVQIQQDVQINLDFFEGKFPTKREFFGLSGQRDLRRSFRLVLNDTLVPQKKPLVRYIGVGYKDKGTRRNLAEDGSPGWKEIGTYFSNLEREAEELDSSISETL